ncbi:hypothetical protein [Amycolatopsis orientalis]|uniref:hypothetical protein n=1 Tax=Amycolatopsis orientalis TaxID=31958 RepID=UPI0003A1F4EA|nr:hypothetical protein [Amycolatopsis orientalis]
MVLCLCLFGREIISFSLAREDNSVALALGTLTEVAEDDEGDDAPPCGFALP